MKKIITLIIITILLGCKTTKGTLPEHVIGIDENYKTIKFQKDSLNFVTPNVELYFTKGTKSTPDYKKREILKENIIYSLRKELKNTKYLSLGLMTKDYLTINKVTENLFHNKFTNPDWIIKAPKELITESKKNTILISITGHYGKHESFYLNLSIINNKGKKIEYSKSYSTHSSPLNYQKVNSIIKKAFSEIVI